MVDAAQRQMLDGVEADHAQGEGVPDGAADVGEPKVLEQPQHLHVLARARLTPSRLQAPPPPKKLLRQRPPDQGRRLVKRPGLALQQGHVMPRLEDQHVTVIAATMAGALLTAPHDHDLVHVAFHHHRAVPGGGRPRVVVAAVAHQRQRRDPRRALGARVIRDRRQREQRLAVAREALPDRLGVPPEPAPAPRAALVRHVEVHRVPTGDAWDRHEEVPARVADQPFHRAVVVALPWPPDAIVEQVVRLELAEDSRPLAGAVTEHPRHRQRGVVVDDAPRHAADVVDRSGVPIAERLRRLRRKGLHARVVAVRQIHAQVVRLAVDAVDDHQRFADVGLGVARWMRARHTQLLPAQLLLAHVGFDDRVAAREGVRRA